MDWPKTVTLLTCDTAQLSKSDELYGNQPNQSEHGDPAPAEPFQPKQGWRNPV